MSEVDSATAARAPEVETVGRTPLVPVVVPVAGVDRTLWLKLEGFNAYGSIKARTAYALVEALEQRGDLRPGGALVESTSGNLGVALAGICRRRRYRCTLVVDADTPERSKALMAAAGAEVIVVPRVPGGNLVAERLAAVRRLLQQRPGTAWTDQYANRANPAVHRRWTGPELAGGLAGRSPDAVLAAVSTGGTLAGLSAYFRDNHPDTRMVAVDAVGSAATGGTPEPRPFKVPGFGSGRPSDFLRAGDWDARLLLDDVHAARACRAFRRATGLALGGSAGAAVLAALVLALDDADLRDLCVVCPDMGDAYLSTVYSDRHPAPSEAGSFQPEALELLELARLPAAWPHPS
jgi:cysteine synthase A